MFVNSEITRNHPSCFLFLLDQSASMAQRFWEAGGDNAGAGLTKAEGVANALNNLLRSLIITCSKNDGVRVYFDVGIIGYGEAVGPAWGGALTGYELAAIPDVTNHFARMEEREVVLEAAPGEFVTRRVPSPVWVEPKAKGSTLMCQALRYAHDVLTPWVLRNQTCHPPVVVHVTDGEATDGDPAPLMAALTELRTANGPLILINVHLCGRRGTPPISFPDAEDGLPDAFARMLFRQASPLTPFMRQVAWNQGLTVGENARAFVLNADPARVALALEIGTRPGAVW